MNRIHGTARLLAISLLLSLVWTDAGHAFSVGKEAPDFALKTHDGRELALSKLEGKRGAVLVFFATWCPACMAEVPRIKQLVQESKDDKVLVYGVNLEQPARVVNKFVKDRDVNYRILLDADGSVAQAYQVRGIPTIVGIDANGIVRYRQHHLPKNTKDLIAELTKPLASAKEPAAKAGGASTEQPGVSIVDRETLRRWRENEKNLVIVDVLSPQSYHRAHIEGAINIPLGQLASLEHKLPKDAKIVTYCANFDCHASTKAATWLMARGYTDVHDYAGGIADWLEADLPAKRGEEVSFISKETLQTWKKQHDDLVILDVLSAESFGKAHIQGAINIPLAQLEQRAGELSKDAKIVTYCANYVCQASSKAAEKLQELGFQDVHDYKGGLHEWREAELPTEGEAD